MIPKVKPKREVKITHRLVVDRNKVLAKKAISKPGPWLKERPENTRIWLPVFKQGCAILKSGAVYEVRSDGWRRLNPEVA